MKRAIFFLLFMSTATSSFASADRVYVAKIDQDRPSKGYSGLVPPLVKETYEYYEIKGNHEQELSCQITQNGCTWKDGKKYASVTSWNVTWNYGYRRVPQGCSTDSFTTTVEITFRYPKWVRPEDAPQPLVDAWDTYMEKLIIHENGHRDMAVQAAADLTRDVSELPAAPSCVELDRKVRELGRERIANLNVLEKEYDATTSHGTTQGAIFPKPIHSARVSR
jgi:predicted secreted Zn-dependent protease